MADQENSIKAARERYNQNVERALKRGGERRERFATTSGIEIKRLYGPDDLENFDYLSDLGFPGEYPFTRGVQPTMYRGRLWTMRQYAGFGTAEESNRRYRYLLEQGQTGLSVAFDLPTQMGRDPDHPLARGEVGRVGVAISSLSDMETLLADLPLARISTSMTINATASILLALYLVVAEKQGVSWDQLNGTIQNDVLKEYVARGTYIYPPRQSMRIITDIFEFATKRSAQLEHDFDLRLPHPRSRLDRGPGIGLHAGRRYRLRRRGAEGGPGRRRVRRAAVVFLQRAQQLLRRDRQVPRRAPAVGANHERALQGARYRAR